jgi:hypothetical protein
MAPQAYVGKLLCLSATITGILNRVNFQVGTGSPGQVIDSRKPLPCQQAGGATAAEWARSIDNNGTLSVQALVLVAECFYRQIEGARSLSENRLIYCGQAWLARLPDHFR